MKRNKCLHLTCYFELADRVRPKVEMTNGAVATRCILIEGRICA